MGRAVSSCSFRAHHMLVLKFGEHISSTLVGCCARCTGHSIESILDVSHGGSQDCASVLVLGEKEAAIRGAWNVSGSRHRNTLSKQVLLILQMPWVRVATTHYSRAALPFARLWPLVVDLLAEPFNVNELLRCLVSHRSCQLRFVLLNTNSFESIARVSTPSDGRNILVFQINL